MGRRFFGVVLLYVLLLVHAIAAVRRRDDDGGDAIVPPLPTLHVPSCDHAPTSWMFGNFSVSDWSANSSSPVPPARQQTVGRICWDVDGIHVHELAQERHIFLPYVSCESPVFAKSDVLELFIAPVRALEDNPDFYFELDVSPSGVMWGGLSNNSLGNSSVCGAANCTPGHLPCTGRAQFGHGMYGSASNSSGAYSTQVFVPWEIFAHEFQPNPHSGVPWKFWRANFYRYDYPDGPNAAYSNYELTAWSPTFSSSFHVPDKFGRLVFV